MVSCCYFSGLKTSISSSGSSLTYSGDWRCLFLVTVCSCGVQTVWSIVSVSLHSSHLSLPLFFHHYRQELHACINEVTVEVGVVNFLFPWAKWWVKRPVNVGREKKRQITQKWANCGSQLVGRDNSRLWENYCIEQPHHVSAGRCCEQHCLRSLLRLERDALK